MFKSREAHLVCRREAYRILKPGGELYFSDVYSSKRVPAALRQDEVLERSCVLAWLPARFHSLSELAHRGMFVYCLVVLFYCAVLLCCFTVLFYCVVLLCCSTVLFYCVVLLCFSTVL